MKIALYARVSSEEQAQGEKASIDQQLTEMRALCERRDWNVVGEFVDCKDYKATQNPKKGKIVNPSGERADRPAFLELLGLLKTGDLDGVACWRDDRLVRHPRVAVALEDALDIGDARRNGKSKIQVLDATGATIDRFTLSIKATIWREENKRRTERANMGKAATLEQGRWPGTYDRLGYTARKAEGRGRVIELVEEEAELVLAICEMYDAGVGVSEIRRRLISDDASQKRNLGRRHDWHPVIIYNVLRCEDYTGQTVWRFGDGKEYRIEIPQIVPRDLWERNQKRLERNKLLSTRNAHGVYLLQGLLECGECQGSLGVRCQHSYNDRKGRRRPLQNPYHEYVCQVANLHREEGHPRPYVVQGQRLDWEVWRYIVDNGIRRPDLIHMQVLARQEQLQRQGDSVDGEINHARRRLAEVDQERAFYQRQGARGRIDEAEFDARMAESEETRRYWQAEINRLTELRDDAAKVRLGLAYVTELLGSLQARLPEIDQSPKQLKAMAEEQRHAILRQRQEIIRAMAEKVIVWSDRQVKIEGVLDGGEGPQFGLTGPWPC